MPPALCVFHDALRVARVALQVVVHVAINLVEVGLVEESAKMVVDVLGQLFCADAQVTMSSAQVTMSSVTLDATHFLLYNGVNRKVC